MTGEGLTQYVTSGRRLSFDWSAEGLIPWVQLFRPSDGWISLTLLAMNQMLVVGSVGSAEWVVGLGTVSLISVFLLGMLTGLILARLPVWGALLFPAGLGVGLVVVVWQITSFFGGESAVAGPGQLWDRLELWFTAAKTGNINIDPVPFAFGVLVVTWLLGYVGVWLFARYRNFWGVFVLGGAGLLSNLTFLPPNASWFLGLYLFTALLLIARVGSVRRQQEWHRRNIIPDGHLGALSLSDSFLLAVAVLVVAFSIPDGHRLGPIENAYESMRSPMKAWEDDFNRLFAGLPARRPIGFRIWGDVMAFQGTINPSETVVLRVDSPTPLYWKARTYGTYTSKGWVSEETTLETLDWVPSYFRPQVTLDRVNVSYSVTPKYASRSLFAGDRVLAASRNVKIETYDSPLYTLDLTDPGALAALPPNLADAASSLHQLVNQNGGLVEDSALAGALPPDLRLVNVSRSNGAVQQAQLAEVLPAQPDVLSVRSAKGKIKVGDTYTVTSSISVATPEALRQAGTDYPAWALVKYTQLPVELPQRVRALGAELTAEANNPYDKAKAIEAYLRTIPYTTKVEPPPFNADGVDHFLFTLQKGYSEYYSSAMAVLLRSVNVPARLATGYTSGDKVPDLEAYVVTDSHAHGWVEVFFPSYGWISFEPTSGKSLPPLYQPGSEEVADERTVGAGTGSELGDCVLPFEECLEQFDPGPASRAQEDIPLWSGTFRGILPWLLSTLGAVALLTGGAWLFWRRYMTPSQDSRVAYRRLSLLGGLSSNGPAAHETPYQYRERLQRVLPEYREKVSVVIDAYVRNRYGAQELARGDGRQIARAWLRLRMPLLSRVIHRGKA